MKFLQISYWAAVICLCTKSIISLCYIAIPFPGPHHRLPEYLFSPISHTAYWSSVFYRLSFGFIFWIFREKKWVIWFNYVYIPVVILANCWKPIFGTEYTDALYTYIPLLFLVSGLELTRYLSWFTVKASPIRRILRQLTIICIADLIIWNIIDWQYHLSQDIHLYVTGYVLGLVPTFFSILFIRKSIAWAREEQQMAQDIRNLNTAVK